MLLVPEVQTLWEFSGLNGCGHTLGGGGGVGGWGVGPRTHKICDNNNQFWDKIFEKSENYFYYFKNLKFYKARADEESDLEPTKFAIIINFQFWDKMFEKIEHLQNWQIWKYP